MDNELVLKLKSKEFTAMWEVVVDILLKVSGQLDENTEFTTKFSPFLLCRYLSMREDLLPYAEILNIINSTSKLTQKQFYRLAYKLVPKQRNGFVKYIKKIQKKDTKKLEEAETPSQVDCETTIFDL